MRPPSLRSIQTTSIEKYLDKWFAIQEFVIEFPRPKGGKQPAMKYILWYVLLLFLGRIVNFEYDITIIFVQKLEEFFAEFFMLWIHEILWEKIGTTRWYMYHPHNMSDT